MRKPERRFPIQAERVNTRQVLPATSVPWSVAERAYAAYSARYGRSQSLEQLAERGGFGWSEMDAFVPGWRDALEARESGVRTDTAVEWQPGPEQEAD